MLLWLAQVSRHWGLRAFKSALSKVRLVRRFARRQ
jgi:hypothetical protein